MSAPTERELLLVQVMLRSALKLLAALRADPPDPAARARAADVLRLSFAPIWERRPFVELEVTDLAVVCDGHAVLEAGDDREGLLAALRAARLRSLRLVPGVEATEIQELLLAVHRARVGPDRDLSTLLFRADLRLLTYELEEPTGASPPEVRPRIRGGGSAPAAQTTPVAVREAVRSEAAATGADRGVVDLEKYDSTLYFLDQREIEYLRSAIDREYSRDLARSALELLMDTLQLRREHEVRSEVLDVLGDLLPYLLGEGRFDAVAYLIGECRRISQEAEGLEPAHKEALDRLRSSVSDPRAVSQLFHALDGGGVQPTAESMGILLRELRPQAIRQVLGWSDLLSTPEAKQAVSDALEGFFTEWPHALERMLAAPQRDVVEAAIELATRRRLPAFVDPLAQVASHPEASIRARVARAFAAIGSAPALRHLLAMADDADPQVRLRVWRTFVSRPHRGALATLERAVTGKDIEARGQREKRVLFEAYGAVAGAESVSTLEGMLRGKSPSRARLSAHTRACAAVALGIVGTPAARKVLQDASDDREAVVRAAVGEALRGEDRR